MKGISIAITILCIMELGGYITGACLLDKDSIFPPSDQLWSSLDGLALAFGLLGPSMALAFGLMGPSNALSSAISNKVAVVAIIVSAISAIYNMLWAIGFGIKLLHNFRRACLLVNPAFKFWDNWLDMSNKDLTVRESIAFIPEGTPQRFWTCFLNYFVSWGLQKIIGPVLILSVMQLIVTCLLRTLKRKIKKRSQAHDVHRQSASDITVQV